MTEKIDENAALLRQDRPFSHLQCLPTIPRSAQMIASLANQFYYVHQDVRIADLAEDLKAREGIWAVGVVDAQDLALGVIVVANLQAQLSRPFANEILGKRPVTDLCVAVTVFSYDKNILTIADSLEKEVQNFANQYFMLQDGFKKFAGIFSTKDLLIHLFRTHRQDLKLAVTIQSAVVPEEEEWETKHSQILTWCKMAKGVGGDFYGVKEYEPGRWALVLCDVSGKGIAASLVTTALGGMFSLYDFNRGLKTFIRQVNGYVLQTFKMEKYLTGVFLDWNEKTKKLSIYDMGHSYFQLLRKGKWFKSAPTNPFIGFLPDLDPKGKKLELRSGDIVAVYTDGFVEQQNTSSEEFGFERLDDILSANPRAPLSQMRKKLHESVKAFRGEQPRGDDEALLLLRPL